MADDELNTRATLLNRLKATEQSVRELAWKDFQARYAPVIAGFARKMGAPASTVEELVQDVVSGFFEAQPRFSYDPAKGRFRGYLKTVTWRQLARRRSRVKGVSLDAVDPDDVAIEQPWNDVWRSEQLKHAIAVVRNRYDNNNTFRAFESVVLNGETAEAVAKALRVNVESVYKARQRVSRALREQLKNLEDEEG